MARRMLERKPVKVVAPPMLLEPLAQSLAAAGEPDGARRLGADRDWRELQVRPDVTKQPTEVGSATVRRVTPNACLRHDVQ